MGLSQIGSTSYTRLVTKQNTAGQSLTTVAFSVGNGATSAWQEIITSTTSDTLITGVGFYSGSSSTGGAVPARIDIAYGASGAESTLDSAVLLAGATSAWSPAGWADFPIAQRVASGQRVAVRATQMTSWGATSTFVVYIASVPYANVEGN